MNYQSLEHVMDQLDIEVFAVSSPGPLDALEDVYLDRERQSALTGFEPPAASRTRPDLVMSGMKSIIAIAVPYQVKNPHVSGAPRGFVTNMAWEFDYHDVVRDRLGQLEEALLQAHPDGKIIAAVDTGPVNDRMMAYGAGLGWLGRNQFVIDDRLGTGFYIGLLMTDIVIEGANEWRSAYESRCGACRKCQAACPARALTGERDFHGGRCISALTQVKRDLSYEERVKIGRSLYGCDLCQWACPKNSQVSSIPEPLSRTTPNVIEPAVLLEMSNRQFKAQYGSMGFAWRGLRILKRNALIVMGNDRRKSDVDYLYARLDSFGPELRPYAIWALMMIDPRSAARFFTAGARGNESSEGEEDRSEAFRVLEWMRRHFRNSETYKDIEEIEVEGYEGC